MEAVQAQDQAAIRQAIREGLEEEAQAIRQEAQLVIREGPEVVEDRRVAEAGLLEIPIQNLKSKPTNKRPRSPNFKIEIF